MYYRFNEHGLLEPCSKDDLEITGGQKYLSSKRVQELSDGKYTQDGWIAWSVVSPVNYGSDGMDATLNPADGKFYDSKSAYYKAVKAKGLEIVGNDAPTTANKPKVSKIDWENAVAETLKQTPMKGK